MFRHFLLLRKKKSKLKRNKCFLLNNTKIFFGDTIIGKKLIFVTIVVKKGFLKIFFDFEGYATIEQYWLGEVARG